MLRLHLGTNKIYALSLKKKKTTPWVYGLRNHDFILMLKHWMKDLEIRTWDQLVIYYTLVRQVPVCVIQVVKSINQVLQFDRASIGAYWQKETTIRELWFCYIFFY